MNPKVFFAIVTTWAFIVFAYLHVWLGCGFIALVWGIIGIIGWAGEL
jgi:hypothetical protein